MKENALVPPEEIMTVSVNADFSIARTARKFSQSGKEYLEYRVSAFCARDLNSGYRIAPVFCYLNTFEDLVLGCSDPKRRLSFDNKLIDYVYNDPYLNGKYLPYRMIRYSHTGFLKLFRGNTDSIADTSELSLSDRLLFGRISGRIRYRTSFLDINAIEGSFILSPAFLTFCNTRASDGDNKWKYGVPLLCGFRCYPEFYPEGIDPFTKNYIKRRDF